MADLVSSRLSGLVVTSFDTNFRGDLAVFSFILLFVTFRHFLSAAARLISRSCAHDAFDSWFVQR